MTGASQKPVLPEGFGELEPYAAEWAIATERERNQFRVKRGIDELQEFYDRVFARIDDITAHVDQFSLDDMPADSARLLWLSLMLMEVCPAVEAYRLPDVPNAFDFDRFHIFTPPPPVRVRG